MRNIVVLQESHELLQNAANTNNNTPSSFTHFSYDYSCKLLYACSASNDVVKYDTAKKEVISLTAEEAVVGPDAHIVALQCIPNMNILCAASNAGELVVYDAQNNSVECVGVVDSGITTMAWSPDFEVLVLGTGKGTVLAMTKDWEVLTEVQATHTVRGITWRGDGAFFATCGPAASNGTPEMIVWERTCALHSRAALASNEQMHAGEGLISWKPTGQLIAAFSPTPAPSPPAQRVIYFERNGLRHGEFALKGTVPKGEVKLAGWSCDSEMLGVMMDGAVQIYHSSNYHWSLKREMPVGSFKGDLLGFEWDPEDPRCIRTFTKDGEFAEMKFSWEYTVCDVPTKSNRYLCGVVDGCDLRFTPFRQVVVPPPMCSFTLKLPTTILAYTYGNPEIPEDPEIITFTSDNSISFFTKANPNSPLSPLKLIHSVKSTPEFPLHSLRQPIWIGPHLLSIQNVKGKDHIVNMTFDNLTTISSATLHRVGPSSNTTNILRMVRNTDEEVLVEFSDGTLHLYSPNPSSSTFVAPPSFPHSCTRIASLPTTTPAAVGITNTGKLYIGSTLLSSECNSFFVQGTFLLYTTTSHKLYFLTLSTFDPTATPTTTEVGVERGAALVAAVALDVRVVLQMPRGNLETIHPHAICLSVSRTLLDQNPPNYRDAFLLLRKYRLDLNILYDYDPTGFLTNVEHFVKQLETVDFLNLFISSLNKDVKAFFSDVALRPTEPSTESKVNIVCDALRKVLNALDSTKYLLSVLTTYVKKEPPELGEALKLIQQLRDNAAPGSHTASKALDYVVFLVDVDRLYDVALGLYDFDLVLMVAQKSQKDPKEYLPFIAKLQAMDKHTQRFTIDSLLGRWDSALENLAAGGEEKVDDAIELMQKHNLYQTAIRIYSSNASILARVYDTYGDYLNGVGKSEPAGYAYTCSGAHAKALSAFKSCVKWREALSAAKFSGMDTEGLRSLSYELAESLKSISLHGEAGILLVEHANDPEAAIVALVEGHVWDEALRLCNLHSRSDLIETHLLPALRDEASTVLEETAEKMESFTKKIERVKAVRKHKILLPQYVGDEDRLMGESDAGSMASGFSRGSAWSDRSGYSMSSTGSGMSVSSTASGSSVVSWQSLSSKGMLAKGGKREKKKRKERVTGKEGSRHEEEYIINALRGLIPNAQKQQAVGNLVRALVRFGMAERAREVQQAFKAFVDALDAGLEAANESVRAVAEEHAKREAEKQAKAAAHNTTNTSRPPPAKPVEITREHVSWMLSLWP